MGWKSVLHDFDAQDLCLTYEIFTIQLKSHFVAMALRHALAHMPSGRTWEDCTNFVIQSLGQVGIKK
jgi:hypothetical protein